MSRDTKQNGDGFQSVFLSRRSHLYVLCRSICNRDQNWIKWSKPFLKGDQGGIQTDKINRLRMSSCNLTFDPENEVIKGLRRQAIKHTFYWSDQGCKCFNRRRISDYPLFMAFLSCKLELVEAQYFVHGYCKNPLVTSTIFWSSQLLACVRDTLQTSKDASNLIESLSIVETLLPFVKLGSSCRRPIYQHFWRGVVFLWSYTSAPGGVPWLYGYGRNARKVAK